MEDLQWIVGALIPILLSINAYFIKRLIEQLSETSRSTQDLKVTVGSMVENLKDLPRIRQDLDTLKIDVGVLKVILRHPSTKNSEQMQ